MEIGYAIHRMLVTEQWSELKLKWKSPRKHQGENKNLLDDGAKYGNISGRFDRRSVQQKYSVYLKKKIYSHISLRRPMNSHLATDVYAVMFILISIHFIVLLRAFCVFHVQFPFRCIIFIQIPSKIPITIRIGTQ